MPDISSENEISVGDAPVKDAAALQEILPARYKVLSVIGSGGAGVVYKARDSSLDKVVAIKTLHHSASLNVAVRFQREAQLAGSLNHPNVMSVIDFGLTGTNDPYLVLEYVEGESLAQRLKRKGALPVEEALDIFVQIALGLTHAHNRSIVHRDIKPSNVMLVKKEGRIIAQIVDFGLAKSRDEQQQLTAPGTGLGTPTYMSPEQIRGSDLDQRSDIYSFGCLMFQTLTGRPPFLGGTALDTINMHLNDAPPTLTEISPGKCSKGLDLIVRTCLLKNPDDRYSSVSEMSALLKDEVALCALTEELFEKPDVSAEDTNPMGSKKNGAVAIVAVATVIGVILVLGTWASLQNAVEPTIKGPGSVSLLQKGSNVSHDWKYHFMQNRHIWKAEDDASDAHMVAFTRARAKEAFWLDLSVSEVTEKGLVALEHSSIDTLIFRTRAVSPALLTSIAKLRSLRHIEFGETEEIDATAIRKLNKLPRLLGFSLTVSHVNQDVLNSIATIKTLEWIDLEGSKGLANLDWNCCRDLKNLHEVNLNWTDVTPASIKGLQCLGAVRRIDLQRTLVDDDCLIALTSIKSLLEINLQDTGEYTQKGLDYLRKHHIVPVIESGHRTLPMDFVKKGTRRDKSK